MTQTTQNNLPLVIYLRNFVFGVEDSLVSTVGLLSGIAISGASKESLFLTGMILICVEAFSMAAGSFLSEHSAEEYMAAGKLKHDRSLVAGVVMFFSYLISGLIPLLPYLFYPVDSGFWISITASLVALFILGLIDGRITKVPMWRSALTVMFVGGAAVALGVVVGSVLERFQVLNRI